MGMFGEIIYYPTLLHKRLIGSFSHHGAGTPMLNYLKIKSLNCSLLSRCVKQKVHARFWPILSPVDRGTNFPPKAAQTSTRRRAAGKCGHTNFKQVMRGGQKRIQRKAKHKWGKKEASEKNGIWTIQCVFASFHVTASHVYLPLGLSLEFKLWNWILQTSMLKKPFIREKAPSKTNDVCWLVCWQLLFVCTLCSLRWWKDTWPWPNHWH